MRPTLFIGISAVLSFASVAWSAGADDKPPPPTLSYSGGTLTVQANARASVPTHLNPDYPWSIKDAKDSSKSLKAKTDFAFSGGTVKEPQTATVSLVPGTLKGAYCTASNCITFTATCTASSCTIN